MLAFAQSVLTVPFSKFSRQFYTKHFWQLYLNTHQITAGSNYAILPLSCLYISPKAIYLTLTPIPRFSPRSRFLLNAHTHTHNHIHTSSVKGSLAMATVNESNLKEPPVSGGCWGCLHCWREDLATCNHKPSIQALFSITQQVRIYCIMASVLFSPDWHIGMR